VAGLPRGARPPRRRRWTSLERDLRRDGGEIIAGVDEVGRGSLAGPVVACAIIMPSDARALPGVDDSKVLPPAERRRLHRLIMRRALAVGLGAASVDEIDRLNIYHATTLAMRRALARLPMNPDYVLIDGRPIRTLGVPHIAVVDGDDKCFSIACASIVAKVTRDRLMAALAARHPAYAWERNVGYGTPAHLAGLRECGACHHHRRRFVERVLAESGELPPSIDDELRGSDEVMELDERLDGDEPAASESLPSSPSHEPHQHM
jgi:ribonuclease HII